MIRSFPAYLLFLDLRSYICPRAEGNMADIALFKQRNFCQSCDKQPKYRRPTGKQHFDDFFIGLEK